jgi:hypothetical protein
MNRSARPGEVNYRAFDRFTAAHYAWGVILGASRLPWWAALGVAIGWEVIERPLKRTAPTVFPHGTQDSWPNMIADATAMFAGWATWQILPPAPKEREP